MSGNETFLIQLARQGNTAACSELFDQHYDALYRYCYYHVADVRLAQDLTSQVFVRMAKNLDRFDERNGLLLAWLYSTAQALLADTYRRGGQSRPTPLKDKVSTDALTSSMEQYLTAETLAAALRYLTEEERQVILLQFLEEHSDADVAQLMGKSEEVIRLQSGRALAELRDVPRDSGANHDFDAVLSQCLDWVRSGTDVPTCLARYPQYATKLRLLLKLAVDIRAVITPTPTGAARLMGRRRMLDTLAENHMHQPVTVPAPSHPTASTTTRWAKKAGAQPVWRLAFAVVATALLAVSGTVAASAASLPGDALYPVKLVAQQAQVALTFDATAHSRLEERFNHQQRQDIRAAQRAGRQATVELQGVLEQTKGNLWTVDGLTITLKPETTLMGQPQIGAWVTLRGKLPGDGSLVAARLAVADRHVPLPTITPHSTPWPSETPVPTDTPEPTQPPTPTYEPEPTETRAPPQISEPAQPPQPTQSLEPTLEPEPTPELKSTQGPKPTQEPKPTKEP